MRTLGFCVLVAATALAFRSGEGRGQAAGGGPGDFRSARCEIGPLQGSCGWISVPEDRSDEASRRIDLRVVVAPAPQVGAQESAIVLLLGGPGDGAAELAPVFAPPLRQIFPDRDLLFVDQRGTGSSNGLFCADDRTLPGTDVQPLVGRIFPADEVAACRNQLRRRAELERYTTPDAVSDLGDVLDVLGYPQADLLGLSYGTRVAQVFARTYPERVRTLVLSGVMTFDIQVPLHYARDAQRSLDEILEACAATTECREQHPDLSAAVSRVWARLDAGAQEVEYADPRAGGTVRMKLGKGDVGYAVRGMLYTVSGQEQIPAAFGAADRGDWSRFAARYLDRRLRTLATGMHLSVLCSEEVARIDPNEVAAATAGTFLGAYIVDDMRLACAEWPAAELPAGYHDPFVTDVPTLLVSGAFDPVTPPGWAEGLAARHPQTLHVVVPGGGHGITEVRGGLQCVSGIVATFVRSAGSSRPSTTCLATTTPPFRN